jgi:hypothetical protein
MESILAFSIDFFIENHFITTGVKSVPHAQYAHLRSYFVKHFIDNVIRSLQIYVQFHHVLNDVNVKHKVTHPLMITML